MFLIFAASILRYYPEVLLTLCAFKFFSQMLSFTLTHRHTDATCAPPTHMKKALFFSPCSMWHVDNILFFKLLPCGAHSVPWTEHHHQWDLWLHSPHNSFSLITNSTLQPSNPPPLFCSNLTAFCVHFKGQHGPQGSTGWQVWRKMSAEVFRQLWEQDHEASSWIHSEERRACVLSLAYNLTPHVAVSDEFSLFI